MENNEQKTFAYVLGNKLEWSGDTIKVLLNRASPDGREGLRKWMERCKPGWFYFIHRHNGMAICTGYAEDAKPLMSFSDEGHGIARKSKDAFLRRRHEISPVQEVKVSWEAGAVDTETLVIGKNGNTLTLSGFALGYSGEGFVGLCWLLDMCGMNYNRDVVRIINVSEAKELVFHKISQSANGIEMRYFGRNPEDRIWEATVRVDRENAESINVILPELDATTENLFRDPAELIDIIISEMKLRGVAWTADPHIVNNSPDIAANGAEWNKIMEKESARIGWNFTPLI